MKQERKRRPLNIQVSSSLYERIAAAKEQGRVNLSRIAEAAIERHLDQLERSKSMLSIEAKSRLITEREEGSRMMAEEGRDCALEAIEGGLLSYSQLTKIARVAEFSLRDLCEEVPVEELVKANVLQVDGWCQPPASEWEEDAYGVSMSFLDTWLRQAGLMDDDSSISSPIFWRSFIATCAAAREELE